MAQTETSKTKENVKELWIKAHRELWSDLRTMSIMAISEGIYSDKTMLSDVRCSLNAKIRRIQIKESE